MRRRYVDVGRTVGLSRSLSESAIPRRSTAAPSDCAEPQVRGARAHRVEGLGAERAAEAVLQDCRLAPHGGPN